MNESLLYFGDGRNNVAFLNGKLPHQTPIKRIVFSDCSRFGNLQSLPQQQSNHSATSQIFLPDFFTTQILRGHVTSRDQGLYSNDQGRKRRETLGTRLSIRELLFCRARGALEFHSIMQSDWPAGKQKTSDIVSWLGFADVIFAKPSDSRKYVCVCRLMKSRQIHKDTQNTVRFTSRNRTSYYIFETYPGC